MESPPTSHQRQGVHNLHVYISALQSDCSVISLPHWVRTWAVGACGGHWQNLEILIVSCAQDPGTGYAILSSNILFGLNPLLFPPFLLIMAIVLHSLYLKCLARACISSAASATARSPKLQL